MKTIANRFASGMFALALASAALLSHACGSGGHSASGFNDGGGEAGSGSSSGSITADASGSSSGGSSSGSSSGSLIPDGGLLYDGGGFVPGTGTETLACPTPTTHDDFAAPVLDMGAPANAATLFAAADVGTDGPCMYEPQSGALFPNNWIRLRLRFATGHQENLFEIKLTIPNETSPLVIYTTRNPYTLSARVWQAITSVGVNGPLQIDIRSATFAGGALTGGPWKGAGGTIQIAPVPASGSVVYWTTSNGTVLKGFQMGSEAPPQAVLTPPQVGAACVGCHTSTPDGAFVALTASPDPTSGDTPTFVDMRSVDGGLTPPPFLSSSALTLLQRPAQHAPSYSPGHWTPGDRIALSMLDVNSVTEIAWTNLEAAGTTQGTDWGIVARQGDSLEAASAAFSHDGQRIVYTSSTMVNSGTNTADGLLYVVPFNGGAGGTAKGLPGASDSAYVQYYPSFSRDDKLIAYNRVPTSSVTPGMPNGASYNNPNAEVFVIPAAGGTATRAAANDPPACLGLKSPGITNSWAKWSPLVISACGNTYYFLVFSSDRDIAAGGPQLYVAPIVVDGSGKITTYSALYLWNQPEAEHNHTPAWDVFQLPPPPPVPQ